MTSLFSKPRALTSLVSHFKTYRPITGKLHVATLTLLLFLVAAAVAVTSSLWLSKTTKQFDRPTLVTTKPVPELESPQKTGVLVNCTSLLNQNRYGSCSRTSLWLNKTKSYNPPTIITTKPVHAPVPVPEKKSTKKTRISVDCTSFLNQNRSGSCSRTPQPGYNNNQTESNRACPDYFKWIHEDLKPWRKTGITREIVGVQKKKKKKKKKTREIVERGQTTAHFRLLIVNGKVFVENYKKSIQTRDAFTLWGILQLLRKYPGKLPDVDLMFDCDDRPVIRSDGYDKSNLTAENAPPVLFGYGGDRWTADIVFPDWSFWGWQEINIKAWSKVLKEMEEGKKKKKFFFFIIQYPTTLRDRLAHRAEAQAITGFLSVHLRAPGYAKWSGGREAAHVNTPRGRGSNSGGGHLSRGSFTTRLRGPVRRRRSLWRENLMHIGKGILLLHLLQEKIFLLAIYPHNMIGMLEFSFRIGYQKGKRDSRIQM